MHSNSKHSFAFAFRNALLGSAALMASGCAADWSGDRMAGRWSQTSPTLAAAQDPYELGKKQFAQGLYGMALKNFRVALVNQPKSLDRLNAVAATYDKLGRFDLAERYYARALGVDPDSVQTLNNIGYSFLMQKDYVSARYYLEQAATFAHAKNNYVDTVGANLVSLDIAEGRGTTMLAALPTAKNEEDVAAAIDDTKERAQGEVHAVATHQDVAKVAAAGTMPEQAGGKDGAGMFRDEFVLVPAALPGPKMTAAPVAAVESQPLAAPDKRMRAAEPVVAKTEPAPKPKQPVSAPVASGVEMLVEVSNGAGRRHLAARTRQFLQDEGIAIGRLTNAKHFNFATSTIFYRKGYDRKAREIASLFPMEMELKAVAEQRAHVRVLLGADSLEFDSRRLAEFKGF